jgi:hypothetical protein
MNQMYLPIYLKSGRQAAANLTSESGLNIHSIHRPIAKLAAGDFASPNGPPVVATVTYYYTTLYATR